MYEGKTKQVVPFTAVRCIAKDDLTAGNGAKHDILLGKGAFATQTTCNVFSFLRMRGLPVAFIWQDSPRSFIAPYTRMLNWEVVVRAEAHGSYLKRNPEVPKGSDFVTPIIEFYLKTKNKRWHEWDLPCDDPFAIFREDHVLLYEPDVPFDPDKFFLKLKFEDVFDQPDDPHFVPRMRELAVEAFQLLKEEWSTLDHNLVDFKVEFGIDDFGNLLLSDVIDNDSWRLLYGGEYQDKQVYRDGSGLDEVLTKYQRIAALTDHFARMAQNT